MPIDTADVGARTYYSSKPTRQLSKEFSEYNYIFWSLVCFIISILFKIRLRYSPEYSFLINEVSIKVCLHTFSQLNKLSYDGATPSPRRTTDRQQTDQNKQGEVTEGNYRSGVLLGPGLRKPQRLINRSIFLPTFLPSPLFFVSLLNCYTSIPIAMSFKVSTRASRFVKLIF